MGKVPQFKGVDFMVQKIALQALRASKKAWDSLRKIKRLYPLIIRIQCMNFFQEIIDFREVRLLHKSYDQTQTFFKQNRDRIKNIETKLADEKSRLVYQSVIKYRCTHNQNYLKSIVDREQDQYFSGDIIKLSKGEIFVDCGAYNGDTIRAFLKELKKNGGDFREIIALEPDPQNYKKLNNWASHRQGGGLTA